MNRPLIGITTSYEQDEQRLAVAYVDAVAAAGGTPLILPMLTETTAVDAIGSMLEGLVVVGGPAVTIGMVGEIPEDIALTEARRSTSDELYLRVALDRGLPVLGICYGMQLLNALGGGTIYADVQAQRSGSAAHSTSRGGTIHDVHITPGSNLHRILGRDAIEVNTRHVQAIERPGAPYRVSATAADGVIEAIEDAAGLRIGVQFHPERMGESMRPLFEHLVHLAAH